MTRVVAAAAIAVAVAVVAVVLVGRGSEYTVYGEFTNASQLVEGNQVKVAGEPVGTVEDIDLTDRGTARVRMTVDDDWAPLRRGTRAIVRIASLSGQANRYVDLHLGGGDRATIEDGGTIETENTMAAVELDAVFDTFEPRTRQDVQQTIRLFRNFTDGAEEEANEALLFLSPSLAATTRLFSELDSNRARFERFLSENAKLFTTVAERKEDVASLISNLDTTATAVASERESLGRALELLPQFLRRSNVTFVNLRSTLDDLDPLVKASTPIVRDKLRPLFAELRPFADAAGPTFATLSGVIRRPGKSNDLIELLRVQPELARIATRPVRRNGEIRPGAFEATRRAAEGATPQFAFFRPYSMDLMGWFDDYSHSGVYDALGGFSRSGLQLNSFTFTPVTGVLAPVPPELRDELFQATLTTGIDNKCPGAAEYPALDGSNPWKPSPGFNCDLQDSLGRAGGEQVGEG